MTKTMKAGWYADPENAARERRWDGAAWTDEARPAPPRRAKKPRTFLKVLGAAMVAMVLLIGGCAWLTGGALNEKEESGITDAEFRSIAMGTTQAAIEARYGKPEDAQRFEQRIPGIGASTSSCIYYPERGKPLLEGASYQLCFDEGRLTSKNAY